MNTDWSTGFLRNKNDVLCLFDINGKYIYGLYNFKTSTFHPDFKIYMPKEFYIPTSVDRPTRYLIHNDQIIITKV